MGNSLFQTVQEPNTRDRAGDGNRCLNARNRQISRLLPSRLRKNSVQSGGDKGFTPVTLLLYRFGGFWYALARASAPPEVDVTRHRSDKGVWNSTQPT